MKLSNWEFNTLILFAFRYALGRRLMAPSVMRGLIRKNCGEIEVANKKFIIDEINHAYKNGLLGDKHDINGWLRLKKELENEE